MPVTKDADKLDRNARRIFGCSEATAIALNGGHGLKTKHSRAYFYRAQRSAAAYRRIGWELTFMQWCTLWDESGHWSERGRGKSGYCMARNGDVGPYATWNVTIQTSVQNSRDGIKKADLSGCPKRQAGGGRGWTYRGERSAKNPYQVVVADKYIGVFPTQEAAEAAYQAAVRVHVSKGRFSEAVGIAACSFVPA